MDIKTKIAERNELCQSLREIIVERLMLDIPADFISNDQPLVGRGLELDSIDSLEISVAINMEMDVTITDSNTDVFSSVNHIVDFVQAERAKGAAE
jgi:acyl carrier protein